MPKKILLAWELGGGLGHVLRLIPLAKRFMDQGCEVVMVLRDLTHTSTILQDIHCLTLQAPVTIELPQRQNDSIGYSDLLWSAGYFSPKHLFGLVSGWQSIYDLVQPDLVLMDYSPTALLASRIYSFKTAWFGSGFFYPPLTNPMRPFRHSKNNSVELLFEREAEVLQTVNAVLQSLEQPSLPQLADLFQLDLNFLCTWQEIDCYARPPDTHYWGECIVDDNGSSMAWPGNAQNGVFCYLKSDQPEAEPILQALAELAVPALVYIRNYPAEWEQRYASATLHFCRNPISLSCLMPTTSLVICSSGVGTIGNALLAGKPLLLLPTHTEQYIAATNVEKMGAGINAARFKHQDFKGLIRQLLDQPSFAAAAKRFASKYRDFSSERQKDDIVASCLKLLS